MTWVAVAVGVGTVATGAMQSNAQKGAAKDAALAQSLAADRAAELAQAQYKDFTGRLEPYNQAGLSALGNQMNILGLNGAQGQQDAIDAIMASPEYTSMAQAGENAILQNASATGGLRGGNTQGALAQFRPGILNQLLQQRYANLAGITSLGQNSSAQTGNAGMQMANSVGGYYTQAGQAQAGSALAQGAAKSKMIGLPMQAVGTYLGMGGTFGSQSPSSTYSLGDMSTKMMQNQYGDGYYGNKYNLNLGSNLIGKF